MADKIIVFPKFPESKIRKFIRRLFPCCCKPFTYTEYYQTGTDGVVRLAEGPILAENYVNHQQPQHLSDSFYLELALHNSESKK
jgi:hypothetical protein